MIYCLRIFTSLLLRLSSKYVFHHAGGNRCGKLPPQFATDNEDTYKYCPASRCCSEYGYCENSTNHCDDGCKPFFGRCSTISKCNLYGQKGVFPTEVFIQRSLESEKKTYWFPLCDSEQIVDDVSQSLPYFTCRKDGSLPEINHKCGNYLNMNT